jgi:hypothetical protein
VKCTQVRSAQYLLSGILLRAKSISSLALGAIYSVKCCEQRGVGEGEIRRVGRVRGWKRGERVTCRIKRREK